MQVLLFIVNYVVHWTYIWSVQSEEESPQGSHLHLQGHYEAAGSVGAWLRNST